MNMKLSDIVISDSFVVTKPREDKVNSCRDFWYRNHNQDRYIVVDHNNKLIDGYIQYLVLKENGVVNAEVIVSEKRKKCWSRKPEYMIRDTAYIYGVHMRNQNGMPYVSKEYVWRIPKSWSGMDINVLPGDEILVNTKYGLRKAIVTKIVWAHKCPVDMPVRKVCRKVDK